MAEKTLLHSGSARGSARLVRNDGLRDGIGLYGPGKWVELPTGSFMLLR
ncbi:hypothetical protein [Roseibium salinum]|uniref:Uncharacterized protein n=1 Tax=Roseibium salinum TaxID=1604349 RepID=A0ABT3R229_9HYPH|nr:hypothetical protein [Roseibium sp. DSM 29163]MCX2723146.1 hypothetical protein [Roseibium sp. DSM 29163]